MGNPRKKNRLAKDTAINMSLLGSTAVLCHETQKCVLHCIYAVSDPDMGHTNCHPGKKCWPKWLRPSGR
jgi:hypothetical protein